MALCPTSIPSYGLSDYQSAAYPGGIVAAISPSAERNSTTKRLTTNACTAILLAVPKSNTTAFVNDITSEYCYFNGLCVSAIQAFVTMSTSPTVKQDQVEVYSTVILNLLGKLVDIGTVVGYYNATITPPNADINTLTLSIKGMLEGVEDRLEVVSQTARAGATGTNETLYKEMEKYSRQKAAYTNNLLGLYSFLNITALGLLVYIYKAM